MAWEGTDCRADDESEILMFIFLFCGAAKKNLNWITIYKSVIIINLAETLGLVLRSGHIAQASSSSSLFRAEACMCCFGVYILGGKGLFSHYVEFHIQRSVFGLSLLKTKSVS